MPDPEGVARRAASDIARHLDRIREQHGIARLALSGGSSPARTFELVAQELHYWVGVEIWFVDERCVSPDDEQSNYRLARETLIEPAGIPDARVHRMLGEIGPQAGARLYATELSTNVPCAENCVPTLDLCVLGIGPDGHVASLFPDAPTLSATAERACLGVEDSPKPPPQRITLTLAVLRAARRCVLIATGAEKRAAVAAMLGDPTASVPASLLARERLAVIVDYEASPPA